ncbi:3993_t:CDS:2 [Cetraspora pellucida]|uniref:3993_t:CDS:1 n=1 Tax=Cetraspora pellucida TaxID=1433469 RepID=A0ACA9PNW8_9GLOM|nr:3993_t:CDS:2 [Cetraspora pellucida]
MSHLGTTNSSLNVTALRELARKDLKNVLDSACILLMLNAVRPSFGSQHSGPLSLTAEFSLLMEHGVEKIHYLQQVPLETEIRSLIYIYRPQILYMKYIAEQIQHHQNEYVENPNAEKYEYTLFFVPRRTMICQKVLEEAGIFGDILDIMNFINCDELSVQNTSFGLFPRIIGKGDCAKHLADMLVRMRREVVVDDPSSSLLNSQSDLIDEVFGIKASHVEVDSSIVGPAQATTVTSTTTSTPIKHLNLVFV